MASNDEAKASEQPENTVNENDKSELAAGNETSPFKKPQFKAPAAHHHVGSSEDQPKTKPDAPKLAPENKPPEQSQQLPLKYTEPSWSALPPAERKFYFEVIKGGSVIEPVDLSKRPYFVVGRMTDCDIPLQHPSLSRYHAVVQYCRANSPSLRDGWYIYDLGSSNGTVVNKKRLAPLNYRPLEIGHVVKFGMSTRLFILQGLPDGAEEANDSEGQSSAPSVPKERPKFQIPEGLKLKKVKQPSRPAKPPSAEGGGNDGCMWGIAMDDEAVYQSGDVDPNFESDSGSSGSEDESGEKKEKRKPLDLSDPKKTLRVFYEREDLGLPDYQVENIGKNTHRAWLEIPTESGKAIRVEGEGGNKKEAVAACAREACISLDKLDLLRPRNKGSKKLDKKKDWAANDYYDSDEDSFFDRTGELEQKRQQRMAREKAEKQKQPSGTVHTESSLAGDLERIDAEMAEISAQLADDEKKRAEFAASRQAGKSSAELDALDAYMSALKQGVTMDATTRVRLKHRLLELQKERSRCERLLTLARGPNIPASLRSNAWLSAPAPAPVSADDGVKKEAPQAPTITAPTVGKIPRVLPPVKFASSLPKLKAPNAFEEENDDDDDFGAGKAKLKKLDEFLKEDIKNPSEPARQETKNEIPSSADVGKPDDGCEGGDEDAVADDGDKRVYSVFLPPELRQSLETHADDVDDIWNVDRSKKMATPTEETS